jgi:antitoxin MazE
MTTTVQKWGNSLALRIPSAVARQISVVNGDAVELKVGSGVLTVRVARPRYSLKNLVSKIIPTNRHGEMDWGKSVGREV